MSAFLICLIDLYKKFLSPCLPHYCKFHPTCSQYAKESVLKYGVLKGCFLTVTRILRCNPFSKGGYDPVP